MKKVILLVSVVLLIAQTALAESLIIGGHDVPEGSLPYHVSVEIVSSYTERDIEGQIEGFGDNVCGGTIIGEQWVVTAAHCLTGTIIDAYFSLGKKLVIRFDSYQFNDVEIEKTYFPDKVIIHPDFDSDSIADMQRSANQGNDIALIKIHSKFPISDIDRAIVPYTEDGASGDVPFYLAGFGYDYDVNANPPYFLHENLQGKNMTIRYDIDCPYTPGMDFSKIFCSNTVACNHDSGGGAVHESGFIFLMGVTSFTVDDLAAPCTGKTFYTDVTRHYDWINDELTNQANYSQVVALCLDSSCSQVVDGTQTWKTNSNVITYSYHGGKNQRWKMTELGNDEVIIRSWNNPRKCLVVDAEGGWPVKGVNIRLEGLKQNGHNACDSDGAVWLKESSLMGSHVYLRNKVTNGYLGLPCKRVNANGECVGDNAVARSGMNLLQTGAANSAFIYMLHDESEQFEP